MGIFDRFKKSFGKKDTEWFYNNIMGEEYHEEAHEEPKLPENEPISIQLPENELVSFSDEILDTISRVAEEKLKHNLKILIQKAKEAKKVDKFMLIREDDFFPDDWEWRVLSDNTNLERENTSLSSEVRKAYALEQIGIEPYINDPFEKNGEIKVPNFISYEKTNEALSKIDKNFGTVLVPSRFRSTKHFTINTPLEVTGDYNMVSTNRDYIIIDSIDAFLNSGYGYSVSYHDAYLDISHESLPISEDAVVLIDDKNYDRIMSDEKRASELSQRRVVRFKGEEYMAINLVLSEMGVLPSRVGLSYAHYDNEIRDILDNSIRELARNNGLLFDKSHGGELKVGGGGHFSNYYDKKNRDYQKGLEEFISFLKKKFPEEEALFSSYLSLSWEYRVKISEEIIGKLGHNNLLEAIEEYNELASNRVQKKLEEYKEDRKKITPEIHQKFVKTTQLLNRFYEETAGKSSHDLEETVQRFLQGKTVDEQLEAADSIWNCLAKQDMDRAEMPKVNGTITSVKVFEEALRETTSDKITEAEAVETKLKKERTNEEVKEND